MRLMKRSLILLPLLTIFTFCVQLAFYYQKDSTICSLKEYSDSYRSYSAQYFTTADLSKNISEEQITRTNFLKNVCEQESNQLYNTRVHTIKRDFHQSRIKIQTNFSTFTSSRQYYCNQEYDFCVCVVPKVGSTIWAQILQVIATEKNYTFNSVFIKPRSAIHGRSYKYRANFEDVAQNEKRSILIARDPYSRLYSAFVDKFYLPNKHRMRVGFSVEQPKICSLDNITFQDFLVSVVSTATFERANPHWQPVSDLCRPCQVNPFAVVKQETFTDDIDYSLKRLNISAKHYNFILNALRNSSVEINTVELVRKYERLRTRKLKQFSCLTPVETASRIWHAFQIQGYIHKDAAFPWKEMDTLAQDIRSLNLMEHITKARENYQMTSSLRQQQRKSYLNDAYKGVDRRVLADLQNVYRNDFLLYNYNQDPPG